MTKHLLNEWNISRGNIFHAAQVTLSLGTLLRKNMSSVGLAVLVAFTGFFEPFSRTTFGFHFWHR
jgi:hypothetical protein